MSDNILELQGISVLFPGVKALDKVNFNLKRGEIHALVGENGAGKSTLMKVMTGVYTPAEGSIVFEGKTYDHFGIEQAKAFGISMIYQELNLVPELKVYENIFLGKEWVQHGKCDKKGMIAKAKELIDTLDINMAPETKVKDLTMAYRQMVEIARALLSDPKILIMDEPTGPLTEREVEILFKTMRLLKQRGVSLIYISHRLEEIFTICDTCTVFRDGRFIETMPVAETNVDKLVYLMVGHKMDVQYPPRVPVPEDSPEIFSVSHLKNDKVKDVSFTLRKGEILGIGGLVGAGRTETLRAIFGCDVCTGRIEKDGLPVSIHSPQDAIAHKIVLVTEDRRGQGLLLNLSVSDNIVLPVLRQKKKGLLLDKSGINREVDAYIEKLKIRTPSRGQIVTLLSGGNQQKVIISRWLLSRADIILFDEPTRGIDVGAKYEIYMLMNELKQEGKSIVMVSSDMPELISMSDRIIILAEGRLTGELDDPAAFTQEEIMKKASNE